MIKQKGYGVVLGLLGSALLLVWLLRLNFVGQKLNQAHHLRTALDSAAYSGAVIQSQALNTLALLNRAYIGHQIATGHLLTLASWADFTQTQSKQISTANPPSWLIHSFFGSQYGRSYEATRSVTRLRDLRNSLSIVYSDQQNFKTRLYQDFVDQIESQIKALRNQIINEVFQMNIRNEHSMLSYEIEVQDDDWADLFTHFSVAQSVQWVKKLKHLYQFLQRRERTVKSAVPVSKRCPHLRHQLRRIGKTRLNAQGNWSVDDTLSFHALRSNRWIGCYYREYAMGWAWQPEQGGALDMPFSEDSRKNFSDLPFWRWVKKHSGWGYLSEGVNPLANTYAVNERKNWQAKKNLNLIYSKSTHYQFSLSLEANLNDQNFKASTAAKSQFILPNHYQWQKAIAGNEQAWFPFWESQLACY